MSDDEVDEALEHNREEIETGYPALNVSKIWTMVEDTRRRGFALWKGILVPEMAAVAVPVRGRSGRVTAAISVTSLSTRLEPDRRGTIVDWIRAEAAMVEEGLARLTAGLTDAGVEALRQKALRPEVPVEPRVGPRRASESSRAKGGKSDGRTRRKAKASA